MLGTALHLYKPPTLSHHRLLIESLSLLITKPQFSKLYFSSALSQNLDRTLLCSSGITSKADDQTSCPRSISIRNLNAKVHSAKYHESMLKTEEEHAVVEQKAIGDIAKFRNPTLRALGVLFSPQRVKSLLLCVPSSFNFSATCECCQYRIATYKSSSLNSLQLSTSHHFYRSLPNLRSRKDHVM
jgi:hypothetical protein